MKLLPFLACIAIFIWVSTLARSGVSTFWYFDDSCSRSWWSVLIAMMSIVPSLQLQLRMLIWRGCKMRAFFHSQSHVHLFVALASWIWTTRARSQESHAMISSFWFSGTLGPRSHLLICTRRITFTWRTLASPVFLHIRANSVSCHDGQGHPSISLHIWVSGLYMVLALVHGTAYMCTD
jgi:hypothetical protein